MSLNNAYTNHAISLGATLLRATTRQGITFNPTELSEMTDGNVFARALHLVGQTPKGEFTVVDAVAALAILGTKGLPIAGMSGGFSVYGQKLKDGGTREPLTSEVHRKGNAVRGLVVPTRLSCDHQGNATLTVEVHIGYNGSTEPFVVTQNIALAALPSTEENRHTLGEVEVAGTVISGVRGIDLDFGIKVEADGADSDPWPSFIHIASIQPKATVKGQDPTWFTNAVIPLLGKCAEHADTSIFLRQRDRCSSFMPTAGLAISMAGRVNMESAFTSESGNKQETVLTITGFHDGTNEPILLTPVA